MPSSPQKTFGYKDHLPINNMILEDCCIKHLNLRRAESTTKHLIAFFTHGFKFSLDLQNVIHKVGDFSLTKYK